MVLLIPFLMVNVDQRGQQINLVEKLSPFK